MSCRGRTARRLADASSVSSRAAGEVPGPLRSRLAPPRRAAVDLRPRVAWTARRVTDPAHDVDEADEVMVDGEADRARAARVPPGATSRVGVVSTAHDPEGRPKVIDLVRLGRAPLSRRPARRGLQRADPAHERRRAGQPAHPPQLRGREGLPGASRRQVRPGETLRATASGVELEDGMHRAGRRVGGLEVVATVTVLELGRSTRGASARCGACSRRSGYRVIVARANVRFGPLELGRSGAGRRRARCAPPEVEALADAAGCWSQSRAS